VCPYPKKEGQRANNVQCSRLNKNALLSALTAKTVYGTCFRCTFVWYKTNIWVYPVLEKFNSPGRIAFFLSCIIIPTLLANSHLFVIKYLHSVLISSASELSSFRAGVIHELRSFCVDSPPTRREVHVIPNYVQCASVYNRTSR
jgi:hypothetical protein